VQPEQHDESGTFGTLSFALLLVKALDQRWTGTLFVEAFDTMHLIQLEDGLVCRVLVPDEFARLGELVVDAGVIMESELELALETGNLLGRALAEQRLIDVKTLQRALVLQILKRLVRLFDYPDETEWSLTDDRTAFEDMPEGVRVDTLRVLWAGIGTHGEVKSRVDATLARIGESSFCIREGVKLSRVGFTGDAARLVGLINQESTSLGDLVEADVTPEGVCRGIIYLLAITRYLDFTPAGADNESAPISSSQGAARSVEIEDPVTFDDSGEISSSDSGEISSSDSGDSSEELVEKAPRRVAKIRLRSMRRPRAAAPDLPGTGEQTSRPSADASSSERAAGPSSSGGMRSGDDPTLPSGDSIDHVMAEIKGRLARLGEESPFTLLNLTPAALQGLDDDALSDVLWLAYEKASRRWHPDSCPHDLVELREGMTKLYSAISDAYEVLLIPETRDVALEEEAALSVLAEAPDTEVSSSGERPAGTVRDQLIKSTTAPGTQAVVGETETSGAAATSTLRSTTMRSPSPPPLEPGLPEIDAISRSAPPEADISDTAITNRPGPPTEVSPDEAEQRAQQQEDGSDPPPSGSAPPPSGRRSSSGAPPSSRRFSEDAAPSKFHERALVALSEQLYTEALALCHRAIEAAPDDPDYVASAVWIQASMPRPDIKVLTLDLDDLLRIHEDHVSARYYRGVLRRRLGYDSAAKQDFERVLQLEREHAGARRQLEQMALSSSERA
jgi:hypothetical protein